MRESYRVWGNLVYKCLVGDMIGMSKIMLGWIKRGSFPQIFGTTKIDHWEIKNRKKFLYPVYN